MALRNGGPESVWVKEVPQMLNDLHYIINFNENSDLRNGEIESQAPVGWVEIGLYFHRFLPAR